jgi:hypothetical protein
MLRLRTRGFALLCWSTVLVWPMALSCLTVCLIAIAARVCVPVRVFVCLCVCVSRVAWASLVGMR